MEKVFIEESNGWFYVYKVECVVCGNSLDDLAEQMKDEGYEVRVGGCLSKFI